MCAPGLPSRFFHSSQEVALPFSSRRLAGLVGLDAGMGGVWVLS